MTKELKEAIKRFRASSESLGYSLDHISDDELLAGMHRVLDEVKQSGCSVSLLAAGFKKIGKGWAELVEAANRT